MTRVQWIFRIGKTGFGYNSGIRNKKNEYLASNQDYIRANPYDQCYPCSIDSSVVVSASLLLASPPTEGVMIWHTDDTDVMDFSG